MDNERITFTILDLESQNKRLSVYMSIPVLKESKYINAPSIVLKIIETTPMGTGKIYAHMNILDLYSFIQFLKSDYTNITINDGTIIEKVVMDNYFNLRLTKNNKFVSYEGIPFTIINMLEDISRSYTNTIMGIIQIQKSDYLSDSIHRLLNKLSDKDITNNNIETVSETIIEPEVKSIEPAIEPQLDSSINKEEIMNNLKMMTQTVNEFVNNPENTFIMLSKKINQWLNDIKSMNFDLFYEDIFLNLSSIVGTNIFYKDYKIKMVKYVLYGFYYSQLLKISHYILNNYNDDNFKESEIEKIPFPFLLYMENFNDLRQEIHKKFLYFCLDSMVYFYNKSMSKPYLFVRILLAPFWYTTMLMNIEDPRVKETMEIIPGLKALYTMTLENYNTVLSDKYWANFRNLLGKFTKSITKDKYELYGLNQNDKETSETNIVYNSFVKIFDSHYIFENLFDSLDLIEKTNLLLSKLEDVRLLEDVKGIEFTPEELNKYTKDFLVFLSCFGVANKIEKVNDVIDIFQKKIKNINVTKEYLIDYIYKVALSSII